MKRKRGIAKRKPKTPSLVKEVEPNIDYVNVQDEGRLEDYNNEVNVTRETQPPQNNNQQNHKGALQNQEFEELTSDDSTSSFPGLNVAFSGSVSKKSRSKMSKPSKALSSSSTKQISIAEKVKIRRTCQRELEFPNQDPEYEEEELQVALEVIRKVMTMDAAEPFNFPVDPVALGMPDYFDIIDTPMDFGTICRNIEDGVKYKNSKDVMKDVQYIWDNCCRYNKKGHYVLELMKRVKKNLTKQWTEAGLCKEQQQELDEDSCIPPPNPTTTCNTYGHRSPLGSVANFARSLQQDREDLTRAQPDQPSLAGTESYKPHQRPGHYHLGSNFGHAEATTWRNLHDRSVDPLDYSFNHPYPSRNSHEILQSQSLWRESEAYQPQQRSCHPSSLQPPYFHQQSHTYTAYAGDPRTSPRNEPTVRGNQYNLRGIESLYTDNSSSSHQNKIFQQAECHDHRSSLCCSQPCRPQRDFRYSVQRSVKKQHFQPFTAVDDDHEHFQRFPGVEDDHAEEFDSHCSEQRNVSCAKQGQSNSKHPMPGFTSHQMQDQIASSCLHEQKASETNRVEKYFSSPPSESLVNVAKHRPAKYPAVPMIQIINRERVDEVAKTPSKYPAVPMIEIINCERPDKVTLIQKHLAMPDEPQLESCQDQSCSQPQTSSPQDIWDIFHAVSKKTNKKKVGRGPAKCLEVLDTEDKIPITTNEAGDPIGLEARKLTSFLGYIARNGHMAPLSYVSWKALPVEIKDKMWQLVQSKFDINPESKSWALKSISRKWAAWKALLKANHYNPHEINEARLADCNERVLPEQWRILVEFWNTPEAQEISKTNKACGSQMKLCHATGSKSHAQVREEQRQKRPDGKEPSQADLFILTRTRKNGQPVTEASSKIISRLRDAAEQQQGTSQQDTIEDKVFVQVMGEDKRKRKCEHPTKLDPTSSKTLSTEAEKIVSEAKNEVLQMKEKMVAVEQTCAQMAAQMAAMMSMMQEKFQQ